MLQIALARLERGRRLGSTRPNKSHIHLHFIVQTPQGCTVIRSAALEELPQNAFIFDDGRETEGDDGSLGKDGVQNLTKCGHDFRHGLVRNGRTEIGKKTTQRIDIDPVDRLALHSGRRNIELALLLCNTVCKHNNSIAQRPFLAACPEPSRGGGKAEFVMWRIAVSTEVTIRSKPR